MDDWRTISATWLGGMNFEGENPVGAKVKMGLPKDSVVFSPMELLLVGLAGCTGMDVVSILEKKRQVVEEMTISVRGLRRDEHPRIYTQVEIGFTLVGSTLDAQAVEQAIQLSSEKYCSASATLRPQAEIRTTYKILTDRGS